MNIEDYRGYCLSLGDDIEEKLPFQMFKNGEGVLVFYVAGHMFSSLPLLLCWFPRLAAAAKNRKLWQRFIR